MNRIHLLAAVLLTANVPGLAPAQDSPGVRQDRYGDPLPDGAIARLGTTRFRVAATGGKIAFLPGAKMIVLGLNGGEFGGGTPTAWDAASGKELRHFGEDGFGGPYGGTLALSADGKMLAVATRKLISLWDLASGTKVRDLNTGNAGNPKAASGKKLFAQPKLARNTAEFAPHGKALVVMKAGKLSLFDVQTGEARPSFQTPDLDAQCAAFTPDGKVLAVGDSAGAIHFLNADDGKSIRKWGTASGQTQALQFSRNGARLVSRASGAEGDSFCMWDYRSGKKLREIVPSAKPAMGKMVGGGVVALSRLVFALSPDCSRLAVGVTSRDLVRFPRLLANQATPALELWDFDSGQKLALKAPPPDSLQDLALTRDGRVLAILGGSVISLLDLPTGRIVNDTVGHHQPVEKLAISIDGKLATMSSKSIRFWDPATAREHERIFKDHIQDMALSPDGRSLVLSGIPGSPVELWDVKQRSARELPIRSGQFQYLQGFAYSADGTRLAVAAPTLSVWDTAKWTQVWTGPESKFGGRILRTAEAVAFSPDGRFVASRRLSRFDGNEVSGPLGVWDAATGKLIRTLGADAMNAGSGKKAPRMEGQGVTAVAYSPDGRTLVSLTATAVQLWEMATGKERARFPRPQKRPARPLLGASAGLALSPDGKLLAYADTDTVRIVDLATASVLRRLPGHAQRVTCLAFSADGRYLFSGSADTTVLVWDVAALTKAPPQVAHDDWQALAGSDAARAQQAIGRLAADSEKSLAYLKKHLAGWSDRVQLVRAVELLERIGTPEAIAVLDKNAATARDGEVRRAATAALKRLQKGRVPSLVELAKEAAVNPRKDREGELLPEGAVARLGTTRFRLGPRLASQRITGVTFFPGDQKLVFSADLDGSRVFDLAGGRETTSLENKLASVTFSADGKRMATFGPNSVTIDVWDTASGKAFGALRRRAMSVSISPNKKMLALRSILPPNAGKLAVWNIEAGTVDELADAPITKFGAIQFDRNATAFSPDGKWLAALETAGHIQLWNVTTRKLAHKWATLGSTSILGFSAGGDVLVTAAGYLVTLWDARTGKKLQDFGEERLPWAAALAHDGKHLAVGRPYHIELRELPSGKLLKEFPSPLAHVLAFSWTGRTLAAVTNAGAIWLVDLETGKELKNAGDGHLSAIRSLEFSAGGKSIVSSSWETVMVWDSAAKLRHRFGPGVTASAISADGSTLAVADRRVRLWDLDGDRELLTLTAPFERVYALAFSQDRKTLAVDDSRGVSLWKSADGARIWKKEQPAAASRRLAATLSFSADGKRLTIGIMPFDGPRLVRVLDAASGDEVTQLPQDTKRSTPNPAGYRFDTTAVSPDQRYRALGNQNGEIQLVELPSGQALRVVKGHQSSVQALVFSPDSRFLVSGSADTTALVWDLKALLPAGLDDWAILAGSDGARAYRTIWKLATHPETALPHLKKQLERNQVEIPASVDKLIDVLGSSDFKARDRASAQLLKLGPGAELGLERALKKPLPLETRRRIESLLAKMAGGEEFTPEQLAVLRSFEVLEKIGTKEARIVLESFGRDGNNARLRLEARNAAARLRSALGKDHGGV